MEYEQFRMLPLVFFFFFFVFTVIIITIVIATVTVIVVHTIVSSYIGHLNVAMGFQLA